MSAVVRWVQWISPVKYSLQAIVISYLGNDNEAVEGLEFDKPATVSANIGVLYVFFVILTIGSVVNLHSKRQVR